MSTPLSSRPRLSSRGWRYVIGRVLREFWLGGGTDLAAKLTFFTVLSFAPTILAVYSLATVVLANNAELVEDLTGDFIAGYNRRHGATVLLTSHYMADVTALCKRVIIIHHGKVLYDGDLTALADRIAPYKLVRIDLEEEGAAEDAGRYGEVTETQGAKVT